MTVCLYGKQERMSILLRIRAGTAALAAAGALAVGGPGVAASAAASPPPPGSDAIARLTAPGDHRGPGPRRFPPATPAPPADRVDVAAVDARLRRHVEATGVPGAAWAVVDRTGVVHRGVAGVDGNGRPVDASTPFLWGSVAKPVAGAVARRLADVGRLDLDARVADALPEVRAAWAGTPGTGGPTVRDLLRHTSGLPFGHTVTDDPGAGRTPRGVVAAHADVLRPTSAPGEYRYSSANYLVLSAVLEAVTGTPYPQLLAEGITRPLERDPLVATPRAAATVSAGHRLVAGGSIAARAPFDPAGGAYGYLGGSVDDLAHVAAPHLPGATPALPTPHVADGVAAGSSGERYGLGWRLRPLPDGSTLAWHSGTVPGYFAVVLLWPERGRALVVLQNASGVFHEEALLAGPLDAAAAVGPTGGLAAAARPTGASPAHVPTLLSLGGLTVLVTWLALRPLWRRGRPGRAGTLAWWAAAALAPAAVVLGSRAAGFPASHAALWAPDIAALAALPLLALPVGAVVRAARRRRAGAPS